MVEGTDDEAGSFTLTCKHQVFFIPTKKEDAAETSHTQMSLASSIPRVALEASKVCKVLWLTKWAVNGLAPIRPVFAIKDNVTLGAGRAIRIV